jgi:hypothetical protein
MRSLSEAIERGMVQVRLPIAASFLSSMSPESNAMPIARAARSSDPNVTPGTV